MEFIQQIMAHGQEITMAVIGVVGAFSAFLLALYGLFLLIPGDQPDKTIKKLLDITKRFSRKAVWIIFMLPVLMLGACAHPVGCLNKIAISEAAITGAYDQSIRFHENGIMSDKKFLITKKAIDSADVLIAKAQPLCEMEDPSALDYIAQADSLITEVKEVLK